METVTLLDTGPLVALMNPREEHHEWARGAFARLKLPLLTCQAVLTEAFFLLRRDPGALAKFRRHVQAQHFVDALDFPRLHAGVLALMERYATVPMSFADACLVGIAGSTPSARILTLDRDFLIYRQQTDRPLTLIAPFAELDD